MGTHTTKVKASGRKATKRKPARKPSKLMALRKAILIPVGYAARAAAHATIATTVKVARTAAKATATAACATGRGLKVMAADAANGALATVKVIGNVAVITAAIPIVTVLGCAEGAGNALKEAFAKPKKV